MAPGEGWRDHWRQNICVLDSAIHVRAGQVLLLRACHDDWRIWFQVCTHVSAPLPPPTPPPAEAPREMGLQRVLYGGHTLRLVADNHRAAAYSTALSAAVRRKEEDGRAGGVCLVLGDGHWLAVAALEAGAGRVVDVEATAHALRMASACFAAASLPPTRIRAWQGEISSSTVRAMINAQSRHNSSAGEGGERGSTEEEEDAELEMLGLGEGGVDLVVADPFYLESHLGAFAGGGGTQWNNLIFWTQVHTLAPLLAKAPKACVMPCGARIMAMGICVCVSMCVYVCLCGYGGMRVCTYAHTRTMYTQKHAHICACVMCMRGQRMHESCNSCVVNICMSLVMHAC